jgi:hypothetical protein
MARPLRFLTALGAAAIFATACASVSNSGLDTQTALSQIRTTYKSLDEAAAMKDTAAIGGYLAEDFQAKGADGSMISKESFAQALSARSSTRIDKFEFEAGKVVAVVTPGAGSASARETWRRSNGGWKLHKVEALSSPAVATTASR